MDDSLRLVHDILDEDRSFLDYLKDEQLSEKARLHRQLDESTASIGDDAARRRLSSTRGYNQRATSSTTPWQPAGVASSIADTCQDLMHELDQVESEISFYDSVARRDPVPPTANPPQPHHRRSTSSSNATITATAASFEAMLAKLQHDFDRDKTMTHPFATQAHIQSRVATKSIKVPSVVHNIIPSTSSKKAHPSATAQPSQYKVGTLPHHPSQATLMDKDDPDWSHLAAAPAKAPPSHYPSTEPATTLNRRHRTESMQQVREASSAEIDNIQGPAVDKSIDGTHPLDVLNRQYPEAVAVELKDTVDRETHGVIEATKTSLSDEQQAVLGRLRDEHMAMRRREMNEILVQHEHKLEREKQSTLERCEMEAALKRAALQRQLDVDRATTLREIETKYQDDLVALDERMRQVVADELQHRREQVAARLLQREEELLREGREKAVALHQANESQDVEKLERALQMGSTLRLQQLRDRLESQRLAKLREMEATANVALERELELVRCSHDADLVGHVHAAQDRLRAKHEFEVDALRKALAVDETRALNDVTEQLRQNHLKRVQRIRDDHERESHERMVQLQQTYEAEYLHRMDELHMELEAKATAQVAQAADTHARHLQAKVADRVAFFEDVAQRLQTELRFLLQPSSSTQPRVTTESDEEANRRRLPESLRQLERVSPTSRQVNQWIQSLTLAFVELSEQHSLLLESLRQGGLQTSSWKQKYMTQVSHASELEARLDQATRDVAEKERLCRRLYKANEGLLKQLPSTPP
ncbi:Aste57867_23518 [Aphanomyces stellatus]|uniref:Aste57867_23518 protein n=1 Tax=Aphanomyces stellatus TaxID=120398 RepID=A0A485LPS5_9STRA|nr:hypothetical protein As57867_023447 [Aphanomyces stellatus]VFU00163.1 Aste57867_23518 [Aphanomyces stellatus]